MDLDSYRARVRSWLTEHLEPVRGARVGRVRGQLPSTEHLRAQRALQRTLHDGGYAGITWPREYGGQGLTTEHQRVFEEESAGYVLPDFAPLQNTTFAVCAPTILAHASHEFKLRHIPAILAGEALWAQFFSEPGAGSDLAAVRTRAVRDGDHWVLTGSKVWSSGAMLADCGMCLARTDGSRPKHQGLTWFAVPVDAPGLAIRPIRESGGGEEFCEEFFDEVVVPDSERIGDVDAGWTVTTTMLGFERSAGKTHASRLGGPPGELPAELVELARRRGTTGHGHVRQQIARVHGNDFVQRRLGARIVEAMAGGGNAGLASYLKLAEGLFTATRARSALEIGGGAAVAWAPDEAGSRAAGTAYLNARVRSIAGGTNEMQRNAIGERVLGLPREAAADRGLPFVEVVRQAGQQ